MYAGVTRYTYNYRLQVEHGWRLNDSLWVALYIANTVVLVLKINYQEVYEALGVVGV